jgi:molybdopterin/thiamine biosynthesis adenylyltransferase
MALTNAQIERYSRQIIVPHLGGRGQQRILAARIVIAGDARDIEAPLAYLVGAGVGAIGVRIAGEQGGFADRIAEMRQLNSDVSVTVADESQGRIDLALLIVGSEAARKLADEIVSYRDMRAWVVVRLDAPGKIVVLPDPSLNPRTAEASILAEVGTRSEAADFIAMLATAEAFKLIAGYPENPSRVIIDFDGYETKVRVLT